MGHYLLTAVATDHSGRSATSGAIAIRIVNAPGAQPNIALIDPPLGATISAPTVFTGIIESPIAGDWHLDYKRQGAVCDEWTRFASGSGQVPAGSGGAGSTLGTLDTTKLLNGIYDIQLVVRDLLGAQYAVDSSVIVDGDMKVGHFTVSFNDMTVPMAGLPLSVTRTYDSRETCPGDFGHGWKLDIEALRLEKNHAMGDGWSMAITDGTLFDPPIYQMLDDAPHLLTVRMPDGETLRFAPKLVMSRSYNRLASLLDTDGDDVGQVWLPIQNHQPLKIIYRPLSGTKGATLTPRGYRADGLLAGDASFFVSEPGDGPFRLAASDNTALDAPIMDDATGFDLTTKDGRLFRFDEQGRLEQMRDPQGNSLSIQRDGLGRVLKLVHTSGSDPAGTKELVFARNAEGYIESISDPRGAKTSYRYDAAGDLRQFFDRAHDPLTAPKATTAFEYTPGSHYLTGIFDAKGVRAARNDYDAEGRLAKTTDADGKETLFTHDIAGRTETIRDRASNTTVHRYDERGNLVETRMPDGTITRAAYHRWSDGLLSELKDSESISGLFSDGSGALAQKTLTTQFFYEPEGAAKALNDGLLRKMIDPLGHTTRFEYDDRGNVLSITDPLQHVTQNLYYPNSNLLQSMQDALGNLTSYTYDTRGYAATETRTVTVSDPDTGAPSVQTLVTRTDYDASGYLVKMTDAAGHATIYENDAHGNRLFERTTRTVPGVGVAALATEHEYDANDRLVKTWDAEHPRASHAQPTSETVYDDNGKAAFSYDALRRETRMDYNSRGLLERTTYADSTFEETFYDADGRPEFRDDRRGKRSQTIYDPQGRVKETWFLGETGDTAVRTSAMLYDGAGRVWKSTDARGKTSTSIYDDAGRRVGSIDALNHSTSFTYDDAGNQHFFTDAKLQVTEHFYDDLNRRVKTIYPPSEIWTGSGLAVKATETFTAYDELGRRVREYEQSPSDQALSSRRSTGYIYDNLGRLSAVVQPPVRHADGSVKPAVTKYAYDELGNQLGQTDAEGRTTSYGYDNLGRRQTRRLPGGQAESMHYDETGNLQTRTDFNGKTTAFQYDALNRLRFRIPDASLGEQTVEWRYTASGQRERMIDSSDATIYLYDARDRLQNKSTPQGSLTYAFDDAGNLGSVTSATPSGAASVYHYDDLNRLQTVSDFNSQTTTYHYDEVGNLATVAMSNLVTASYHYNALNRLTSLSHIGALQTLASYTYTLNATGQRHGVAELNGRAAAYDYDAGWRLQKETITGAPAIQGVPGGVNGALQYTLDAVGNRQNRSSTLPGQASQSFGYDANDRVNGDTYDSNGNTRQGAASQPGTLNSGADTYDAENRLINRQGSINGQPATVHVDYNGDGQKVRETVTQNGITTVTTYLIDDLNPTGYAQVVEEKTNGVLTRVYTYGHSLISQDQLQGSAWQISYYGSDGHGNIRFLTGASGAITDTYDYDAFGNLLAIGGATPNRYLYCGEQFDSALGLYYLRARMMNPLTGRFWNADTYEGSKGEPESLHKYLYCGDEPLNRLDPSGHFSLLEISGANVLASMLISMQITAGKSVLSRGQEVLSEAGYDTSVLQGAMLIADAVQLGSDVVLCVNLGKLAVLGPLAIFRSSQSYIIRICAKGLPQGLTPSQFSDASALLRRELGDLSNDIVVQGSRAAGTAKATSDIDFAARVSSAEFNDLISKCFGKAKLGTAKGRTMLRAIDTGKIQAGEAGISSVRRELEKTLGMDVDLSIIERNGPFDNGSTLPIK